MNQPSQKGNPALLLSLPRCSISLLHLRKPAFPWVGVRGIACLWPLVTLPAIVTHSHSHTGHSPSHSHSHTGHSPSHSHSQSFIVTLRAIVTHTGPPHSHPPDPTFHRPTSSPVSLQHPAPASHQSSSSTCLHTYLPPVAYPYSSQRAKNL